VCYQNTVRNKAENGSKSSKIDQLCGSVASGIHANGESTAPLHEQAYQRYNIAKRDKTEARCATQ
jgi:hypothetical protein